MRGEPEAILIVPPTGNGQTYEGAADPSASQVLAFTTSTGAPTLIVASGWVTFTPDQDCRIRFWRDNSLSAATQSDFPFWQKSYLDRWCDGFLWMRVIGITASGNLYYYPSSR